MSKTHRKKKTTTGRKPKSIRIELNAEDYDKIAERAKAVFSKPPPYTKGIVEQHARELMR